MTPVRPEELSALLDGELDPSRAREVRQQIDTDPALRWEFEELSAADASWRKAAAALAFTPRVELPIAREAAADSTGWLPSLATATGLLILVRIVLKLAGSEALMFGLPAMLLALLLVGVVGLVRAELDGPSRLDHATRA